MNRLLVLSAYFLNFQTTVSGQTIDFAPVGSTWYFSEQAFIPPPFGSFPHIVEVESKEVYQGKLCSKITGVGSETVPEPLYVYDQNDSVFFYSLFSNRFELLYDFNAETSDTWVIGGLFQPDGYDSIKVRVDSISQIVLDGTSLKVLHISYSGEMPYDWGYEIITGVGNTGFLTPDYGLFEGGAVGLRCYSDPDNDFHFVSYPCDTTLFTSGVTDVGLNSGISVFPNPGKDHLNIFLDMDVTNSAFCLHDRFGQLMRQMPIQAGLNKLETEMLPPGLYFWEILNENKRIKYGQTIIARK